MLLKNERSYRHTWRSKSIRFTFIRTTRSLSPSYRPSSFPGPSGTDISLLPRECLRYLSAPTVHATHAVSAREDHFSWFRSAVHTTWNYGIVKIARGRGMIKCKRSISPGRSLVARDSFAYFYCASAQVSLRDYRREIDLKSYSRA